MRRETGREGRGRYEGTERKEKECGERAEEVKLTINRDRGEREGLGKSSNLRHLTILILLSKKMKE